MSWPDARRRVWPLQQSGVYILEALQPMTTYDFRFGAKNLVGFSEWGAAQQFTMPRRGPPEAPAISRYPYYKYIYFRQKTTVMPEKSIPMEKITEQI